MNAAHETPDPRPVAARARRRITRRLLPFLFLLYVLNYIDRVNVGYAALDMTIDLGFSNTVFGLGAGIFFIGYFVFQVPGTLLIELWSARKFIGISLCASGLLAASTAFVTSGHQFYAIRFALGAAEAGFFPGIVVYLTHWFRYEDRAKAVAMFMTAIPASNLIGAPLAAVLLRADWLQYAGWRWLLFLEGAPAVIAGVVAFFLLTDRPEGARWLKEDERRWITDELDREKRARQAGTNRKLSPWQAIRDPRVALLALAYFGYITNSIGLGIWLPKIVKGIAGLSTLDATLVVAIPWLAAVPSMLFWGWHSDRTGERRWHTAAPILVVSVALAMSQLAGDRLVLAIAVLSVATMSLYAFPSPFWSLPTLFLSDAAAAASIGLMNSVGNLGGFAGPYVIGVLTDVTGNYTAGVLYLMGNAVVAGVLVLSLRRFSPRPEDNRARGTAA